MVQIKLIIFVIIYKLGNCLKHIIGILKFPFTLGLISVRNYSKVYSYYAAQEDKDIFNFLTSEAFEAIYLLKSRTSLGCKGDTKICFNLSGVIGPGPSALLI